MLISKRRLQWGTILFLTLLAIVLFRPARAWLDQTLVTYLIDPDLSVGQVTYHSATSVLEARQLGWSKTNSERAFGFRADRAWIAVDAEPLLDRQISIPHAKIEQAELFLQDYRRPPHRQVSLWQQELAERLVQLDWRDIRQHFGSLLSAEDVLLTWGQRMDQWTAQSHEILSQAQTLQIDVASLPNNPLRLEDDLKEKISRVNELSDKQQVLLDHFQTIQKRLQAECRLLKESFEEELGLFANSGTEEDDQQSAQRMAESIVLDMARQVWSSYAEYGEIADALAAASVSRSTLPTYDRNVYRDADEPAFLELNDLQAQGHFFHQSRQTPFSLQAGLMVPNRILAQPASQGHWAYQFLASDAWITVSVDQDAISRAEIQLQVHPPAEEERSPSDLVADDQTTEEGSEEPPQVVRALRLMDLNVETERECLAGEMRFLPRPPSEVAAESSSMIHDVLRRLKDTDLQFQVTVSGSWTHPTFTFAQPLPAEVIEVIHTELTERRRMANADFEQRVRGQFDAQVAQLQSLVARAAGESQALVDEHQRQLVAAKESLQQNLDHISGAAFARRPGQPQTR